MNFDKSSDVHDDLSRGQAILTLAPTPSRPDLSSPLAHECGRAKREKAPLDADRPPQIPLC